MIEQNCRELNNNLQKLSTELSPRLMTELERLVVYEYLGKKALTAQYASLNLAFWFKFAQAINLYRPKVEFGSDEADINFYALLIAPSGNYKDQALKALNKSLLLPYYDLFKTKHEFYLANEAVNVKNEAEERYGSKAPAAKESYIESNSPRTILTEGSDGTIQGWHAQREAISLANFGSANYVNSEFGDILQRFNESDSTILTYLKESYDGATQALVYKGIKTLRPIDNVPSNMFAHSPIASITNAKAKLNLMRYLDSGLARRTMICYEPERATRQIVDQNATTLADYYIAEDKINKDIAMLKNDLAEKMSAVLKFVERMPVIRLDGDAWIRVRLYRDACRLRAKDFSALTDEGAAAEIDSRWIKTIKLAALMAYSDMAKTVSVEHITKAMTQVEYYSNYVARIYEATAPGISDHIYNFLVRNLNKEFTSNEVCKQAHINRTTLSKYRVAIHQDIRAKAAETGHKFIYRDTGGRMTYLIQKSLDELDDAELDNLIKAINDKAG